MKQLNIFELQNSINKRKQNRTQIYESVLEKCHMKIKAAAKQENYQCIYDIPEYVVGLPLYNINECMDFIINQLNDNGFKVNYYFPKVLHISWYPQKEQKSETEIKEDPSLLINYIPYKNEKGKFTLNID